MQNAEWRAVTTLPVLHSSFCILHSRLLLLRLLVVDVGFALLLLLVFLLLVGDFAVTGRAAGVDRDRQRLHALGRQLGGDFAQLFAVDRDVDRLLRLAAPRALVRRHVEKVPPQAHLHEVVADRAVVGGG